jgi:hypothetical protein
VNRHLERARKDAAAGKPYTIQLLSSPSDQWSQEYHSGFIEYWQKLGHKIGKPVARIPVPEAVGNIWNRAVSVRSGVVLSQNLGAHCFAGERSAGDRIGVDGQRS